MPVYSLDEHRALIYKAARGAGMEWGLAEEAGYAALWLAARRMPFIFGDALFPRGTPLRGAPPDENLLSRGVLQTLNGDALCPVAAGTLISDFAALHPPPWRLRNVLAPLILAPFLCRASSTVAGKCLRMSWQDTELSVNDKGLWLIKDGGIKCKRADVRITAVAVPKIIPQEVHVHGNAVTAASWNKLGRLAARTYVPASAHSRKSGAGAGNRDND